MRMPTTLIIALAALLVTAASAPRAQEAGDSVIKRGTINEDIYLAGGSVDVQATVEGDVVAAGGSVSVAENVRGDAMIAGGNVMLRGRINDDVRAAGGTVTVDATIGDDALIAAGNLVIAPSTTIGGRAWLAGGDLEIGGRIGRELRAAGGHIVIAGEIRGDAEVVGERIEVRPTAVIHGSLRYMSAEEATIDPAAKIAGGIVRLSGKPREMAPAAAGVRLGVLVSLAVTGAVVILLFPVAAPAAAATIGAAPWKSLGLGLAVLAATPLLVLLLFVTLIGVWLALTLLALYLVALLLGHLTGVLWLAGWGLGKVRRARPLTTGWRILAFVLALIALALIGLVPVLGGLIALALLLAGLGALSLSGWRRYTGGTAA